MPCFLLLVILLFPRVAAGVEWIYSTYLHHAFHGGLYCRYSASFSCRYTIVYAWN